MEKEVIQKKYQTQRENGKSCNAGNVTRNLEPESQGIH